MRKRTLIFPILFICFQLAGQGLSLISWNIRDFGKTKNADEIAFIAEVVKDFDLVAIQEVVKGYGGSQAVARLADQLNRMGAKWDYRVSDPTNSPPYKTERYAFLWRTSSLKLLGRPKLVSALQEEVYREPYYGEFLFESDTVRILNYHSRRFDEQPEEEIAFIVDWIRNQPASNILLAGDFNLMEDHTVFIPLYARGYLAVLDDQPTTLKQDCPSDGSRVYLNHSIDNIFYPADAYQLLSGEAVDFVGDCRRLEEVRAVSDHLGVGGYFLVI